MVRECMLDEGRLGGGFIVNIIGERNWQLGIQNLDDE
jgi:hypothetical protein